MLVRVLVKYWWELTDVGDGENISAANDGDDTAA